MDNHRSGLDSINREQNSRNNDRSLGMRQGKSGGGSGPSTANTGGSMAVHKNKDISGGSGDVKALGRASAGKIETGRGKK